MTDRDIPRGGPVERLGPLGRRIMSIKRLRIAAAVAGARARVWRLTIECRQDGSEVLT